MRLKGNRRAGHRGIDRRVGLLGKVDHLKRRREGRMGVYIDALKVQGKILNSLKIISEYKRLLGISGEKSQKQLTI